jgi:GTP-binding protein EngB required for normal cell division
VANDFNESHRRRLLASAQYADKLLSDIEAILNASDSRSPFPKYRPDVSLHQARLIRAHLARFRDHLTRVLAAIGIQPDGPRFGSLHSIRVTLAFVRVAVQEMSPEHLRGYGELSPSAAAELRGLSNELEGLIDALERNLALGEAADLQSRLERLEKTTREAEILRLLDQITVEEDLAEFRSTLLNLAARLESRTFEIAVFGRVSSGKSSLLNHLLGTDVLPVGVNPITAVPTRLLYAPEPSLTVSFSDRRVIQCPIADLADYASEERNPGNEKGVSRLVVALPSPGLQNGLVLVDTPGLGALATSGAAETLSYLPQCDLGVFLISAASPINDEDLNTLHALARAAIPVMVLLSKADLVSPADCQKALDYTRKEILSHLGLRVDVDPVSTAPAHQQMLEDWRRLRLAPLFERHADLARQAIRRKTGALRESVAAALRAKLESAPAAANGDAGPFEEVERRLRAAAGEIENARRFCLRGSDEIRLLAPIAFQRAVAAVLESWSAPAPRRPAGAPLVVSAAENLAAEAASQISARLAGLAGQLQSALQLAAAALGEPPSRQEEPLAESVRELPRFESALPGFELSPPWFASLRGLTRLWISRRLAPLVRARLELDFANYGRAVEAWIRRVLADLQTRFDARADAARAQLARLSVRKSLSPEDRARIERRLAALEEFALPQAGD